MKTILAALALFASCIASASCLEDAFAGPYYNQLSECISGKSEPIACTLSLGLTVAAIDRLPEQKAAFFQYLARSINTVKNQCAEETNNPAYTAIASFAEIQLAKRGLNSAGVQEVQLCRATNYTGPFYSAFQKCGQAVENTSCVTAVLNKMQIFYRDSFIVFPKTRFNHSLKTAVSTTKNHCPATGDKYIDFLNVQSVFIGVIEDELRERKKI